VSDRLAILHVTPFFSPIPRSGGFPPVIRSVTNGLAAAGHEVHVWTGDVDRPDSREMRGLNPRIEIRHLRTSLKTIGNLMNSPVFPELIVPDKTSLAQFDIVHQHGYWFAHTPTLARACGKAAVPLIIQPHGTLGNSSSKNIAKKIFHSVCRSIVIGGARALVAVSEGERRQLAKRGFPRSFIKVVHNPIVRPNLTLPSRNDARAMFDLPSERSVILYLGRLHKDKGVEDLLLAFGRVRNAIGSAILLFAGPDDGVEAKLKRVAKRLNLDGVQFLGILDDKAKWSVLRAADVLCLPSKIEGFPVVVLEAGVAGTPVIISSDIDIPELVDTKAVLVSSRDPESLARSLVASLNSPDSRALISEQMTKCLDQDFSENRAVEKLLELYRTERLLNQRQLGVP
jgi:glycosyltransferase involved in cell wall biosynthesis